MGNLSLVSIDFDKISRAISNTYRLIQLEESPSEAVMAQLKEAEHSLNCAKSYVLTREKTII